jgi:phasin protein
MLANVKEKAVNGLGISADFIEACAERQINFATSYLQSSLENLKKLRHSKNLNDIINAEKDYIKGVQDQLSTLTMGHTEALKTFGNSAKDFVSSIVQPTSSVEPAMTGQTGQNAPDIEKKPTIRKGI